MNSVNVIGRLTQHPELKALASGKTVCRIRLAVKGMGRGGVEEPGYINVAVFGEAGEAAARTLTKGWLVGAYGKLQYGEWENDQGERRHDHEIVGNVQFLAAPRSNGEQPAEADTPAEEVIAF
jgi:single-strand DNA-binding protein